MNTSNHSNNIEETKITDTQEKIVEVVEENNVSSKLCTSVTNVAVYLSCSCRLSNVVWLET